jgi:hydroxymethylglutaryl-CoA reductase (NADPH)
VFATLDANMSGDKKASMQTFQSVRGRKVSAEAIVPRALCVERLNPTPERLKEYHDISYVGGLQSGTLGIQGHDANGLTALYRSGRDRLANADISTPAPPRRSPYPARRGGPPCRRR